MSEPAPDAPPSVFHITHWKAGSQWVSSVLKFAVGDRLIHPEAGVAGPLGGPYVKGKIYSPVYATATQFRDLVPDEPGQRTFVVLRDLRDTLVSWYFSLMYSHGAAEPTVQESRDELRSLDKPEGLVLMIDKHLQEVDQIQREWLTAGARIFRYEDLVGDQQGTFKQMFSYCQIRTPELRRRWIVFRHGFKVLTCCRFGREDPKSHLRKGMPGDWKNHFTDEVKRRFKDKYGETLVRAGYEKNDAW